jgi:hypothetical protein
VVRKWRVSYLPAGVILDGSKARDALNTGDLSTLRPGMVLGKITSGGKYAPTILGVTTVAVLSGATTVTVSAATATEIVRRIGATGTNAIKVVGPPTAAGTVAATAVTHSAVNTTTGVITISATAVAIVTNSLITAADGSETPKGILDQFLRVTDVDGNDLTAVQVSRLLVAGFIDEARSSTGRRTRPPGRTCSTCSTPRRAPAARSGQGQLLIPPINNVSRGDGPA